MHLKRWITGLVALPFLVFIIYKGGVIFATVVSIVSLLSLWEYFRIVLGTEEKMLIGIPLLAFITGPLIIWTVYVKAFDLTLGLLAMNLIVSGLVSVTQFKSSPRVIETIKSQVQGIVYVPLFLSFLVLIRNGTEGMLWIALLLCLIFAGDISAYYFGSYLGRRKLAPAVSPGKTIEGAIGGLAANLAVGSLFKALFLPGMPWVAGIIFFLIVGIMGQAGDLFESALKRASNIKDSGGLLPGHGGFLDRIDALLFAAPVVYLFKGYVFQA
ncbi:MAG: phosphatidate cytidylyltransferase [Deltaproteobacteria bacterium]|nr:MAG: phosphatidate cytidylyltransferase [Deltaproteobacteria bacterium]